MPDNFVSNPASGGSTFAADDISTVLYPRSKITLGADGVNDGDVSASNPMPVTGPLTDAQLRATAIGASISTARQSYWPAYTGPSDAGSGTLSTDDGGALITRGAVTTDEGTFRVNFANSSLAVSVGTVTVSGSIVTGTGFITSTTRDVHSGDYFKLDADGESAWRQIESIDSDTQLTLSAAYVGGSSGAASRALMRPVTGSGGSISVASGACTLASGTTINAQTYIVRNVDYSPLVYRAAFSISQRIANQTILAGMSEPFTVLDRWYARFSFSGTTNTVVTCETARNPTTTPSGAEIQSTTVTLPNGVTTATSNEYRIELLTERVVFYINGIRVAEHTRVIPSQHDEMEGSVRIVNGASAPASTTSVVVDYVTGKNHNKLEVGIFSDTEQVVVQQPDLVPFSYNVAGVIAINTVLLTVDCLRFRLLGVQCTSMGTTGVVTPEWSLDGTTWVGATIVTPAGATATTFNAAGLWNLPVFARYFRLRLSTATTAGTTTIQVVAYAQGAGVLPSQNIQGSVTADTEFAAAAALADGFANPTTATGGALVSEFNGTTWDRQRGNTSVSVEASSAKTASGNSAAAITNHSASGVVLFINVSAASGTTPTLVVRAQMQDPVGAGWIDIPGAATASITGVSNVALAIYPGVTVAANAAVSYPLPRVWRLAWVIGGTTPSFTFSVGAQYVK